MMTHRKKKLEAWYNLQAYLEEKSISFLDSYSTTYRIHNN